LSTSPLPWPSPTEKLWPILSLYEEYTDSVASSTTLQKTTILCIKTPALLCDQLLLMGMAMPENAKHLGLHLGKTIDFMK
jgi:hypothetical protein